MLCRKILITYTLGFLPILLSLNSLPPAAVSAQKSAPRRQAPTPTAETTLAAVADAGPTDVTWVSTTYVTPPLHSEEAVQGHTLFLPVIANQAGEDEEPAPVSPTSPQGIAAVTPEVVYFHYDATGNVLAVSDDNGAVVWRADVRPFGQGTSTSLDYPLRFDDQPQEAELGGLYHLGARTYDPFSGRFLGPDPLPLTDVIRSEPQRFNRYSYALNNPYAYRDPTGLEPYRHKFTRPWHAALWALQEIYQTAKAEGVEYGGIIYLNEDGTYSYSAPRTDRNPGEVNPWPEEGVPGKAIGFYHTHPRGENFSQNDLDYAQLQRIDAYVATPSGDLLRYNRLLDDVRREKGIVQQLLDTESWLPLWLFQVLVLPDLSGSLD